MSHALVAGFPLGLKESGSASGHTSQGHTLQGVAVFLFFQPQTEAILPETHVRTNEFVGFICRSMGEVLQGQREGLFTGVWVRFAQRNDVGDSKIVAPWKSLTQPRMTTSP